MSTKALLTSSLFLVTLITSSILANGFAFEDSFALVEDELEDFFQDQEEFESFDPLDSQSRVDEEINEGNEELSLGEFGKDASRNRAILKEQKDAVAFLDALEPSLAMECNENVLASWNFATNISETSRKNLIQVSENSAENAQKRRSSLKVIFGPRGLFPNWKRYPNPIVRRRVRKSIGSLGISVLEKEDLQSLLKLVSDMKSVYSTASICLPGGEREGCGLRLDPDVSQIMATSRDPIVLRHLWKAWRNVTGKKIRADYMKNVVLLNEAARLNGLSNAQEMWMRAFGNKNFEQQLDQLWMRLAPLYKKVHAFVRMRLVEFYGLPPSEKIEPIPAHLLGNMWAQSWANIRDIVMPCTKESFPNITAALIEQEYTPEDMFELADDFFVSLGMKPVTENFWKESIFVRPPKKQMVCHASAWDFCHGPNGDDYRIKMCTKIDKEDLVTVHHELGHIQYYMQYKDQPKVFRRGANPGFHEAVGDTIGLSVGTHSYLRKVGLLERRSPMTPRQRKCEELNHLMDVALKRVVSLPWTYLVDKWRWGVFSGKIPVTRMNSQWWILRESIQGVKAPVKRTEGDFDPGAKYHITANVPYDRYFVSNILQFQFYEALCKAAGRYEPGNPKKPLNQCDFYQSKAAGALFSRGLCLGSSVPWPLALEVITGRRRMTTEPIIEYFRPLEKFLETFLNRRGECIGWRGECFRRTP